MVRRNSFEIDPASHPLAPAIMAFNRGNGWYRAVIGPPAGPGWVRLAEFSGDVPELDRRLQKFELIEGGHAGYAAAALIQQVAHPLVSLIAWCVLTGPGVPELDPGTTWLRGHPHGIFDRVSVGGGLTILPEDGEETARVTGERIVGTMRPLVASIRSVRKVGLPGLWRGVGDLVARCFIGAAAAMGSVETGVAAAEAILVRAPDPIRTTPRWHRNETNGMWFALRSVCCLAFTGIAGIYCDTCPLLDDDEILRRLASNPAGAV